ncbi:glycosyltransferase family 2 protein [Ruficoccus sp. ZRK36]|uniref:glycosyltransferase family 2 protein n=1 Tax=Ruficoccus sp. ZRK36 TaxID=2866311 RepID=UPI001C73D568|nr:glycosyltransferase family 2 protein [Ruficoccus sp. ZRK36]QYY36563.1 glycosyltransferase family 2 protein [Ruficoccus sp. ZRK36]
MPEAPDISVIILTLNEERDLPGCLDSLKWCDDIHLLDSGSTDRTVELAKASGATVSVNAFQSFGQQRNWALDHCPIKHSWVLFLDADERITPTLLTELSDKTAHAPNSVAGYYCCWALMLGERWLKRADNFPKWQFRLMRVGRARFTDFGHGQKEDQVDGEIDYIKEPYLHYAFGGGWEVWEKRHRKYAQQEALARRTSDVPLSRVFSRHASRRNPAIKRLVSRLPGWPLFRFFYTYVLRGGLLEGREAWEYCRRLAWYEALIQKEMKILRRS